MDDATTDTPKPARRRALWVAAGAVLALGALAAGLWAARVPLAQAALDRVLAGQDIAAPITARIDALTPSGAALSAIAAPGLSAERIELSWRWDGFGAPRPETLLIEGLDLRLTLDGARRPVAPAWLARLLAPPETTDSAPTGGTPTGSGIAVPRPPFEAIRLVDARLDATLPEGSATLALSGALDWPADALPDLALTADGTALGAPVAINGDLGPADAPDRLGLGVMGTVGPSRLQAAATLTVARPGQGSGGEGIALAGLDGPARFVADARLGPLAALLAPDWRARGTARIDAAGTARLDLGALNGADWVSGTAFDGTFAFDIAEAGAEHADWGALETLSARGTLELATRDGWLRAATPVSLRAAGLTGPWVDALPADLARPAQGPLALTVARLEIRTDGAAPRLDADIALNADGLEARASGGLSMALDADSGAALASEDLTLTLESDGIAGIAGRAALTLDGLRADAGGVRAGLSGKIAFAARDLPGGMAVAAEGPVSGGVTLAPERVAMTLDDTTRLTPAPLDLPQGARLRFDAPLAVAPGQSARIALPFADALAGLSASLPLVGPRLRVDGARGPLVTLEAAGATLSVEGDERALSLRDARVTLADAAVTVTGLSGLARLGGNTAALSLSAERLTRAGAVPLNGPFTVNAGIEDIAAPAPRLEAQVSAAGGAARLDADIRLAPAGPRGAVTLAPIAFEPGGRQPADISPLAAGLEAVVGEIAARADIDWSDGPAGTLDVTLTGLGLNAGPGRLSAVTGDIRFDLARLPATAPAQRLGALAQIGSVMSGPIDLVYEIGADGGLWIERLTVPILDGAIGVTRLAIPPGAARIETVLDVDRVDLGAILGLADLEGLSGTGRLTGALPVRFENGAIAIDRGQLTAIGPGTIAYRGSALDDRIGAAGESVDLLLRALRDFRYEALAVTVQKSQAGLGTLGLRIEGRNPAVLDGYPFNLNINLESDFDRLSRFLMLGFATAEEVLEWAADQATD